MRITEEERCSAYMTGHGHIRRGRGVVSRAASALMFALAGVAAFVFPQGEAGTLSVAGGFAPAQVPLHNSPNLAQYRSPSMCADLGGTLQEVDSQWVCKGLDRAGTLCVVGAGDVFPCRGLFRHVIQCNDVYNRPALNPFICDAVCRPTVAPWGIKARGANCEYVVSADEILPEADRTVNLPNFPDGYVGSLATLQVLGPELQGTTYEDFVLINHRPLGPGVGDPQSADQLTIAAGNVLGVPEYAPLRIGETSRMLIAKNSCPDSGFRAAAGHGCYPVYITITANFQVTPRTDIVLNSVAANRPAAVVTVKTAVGHSGFGFDLSLQNTADYALTDLAYDANIHGFDPDSGVILIDPPIQAGSPIIADVEAGVECRTIPYCNPARISVTVVFEPVVAPSQPDASQPGTDPFFLSAPIALPDGYAPSEVLVGFPGTPYETATGVANFEVIGIEGYNGNIADFAVTDSGNLANEDSQAVLPVGDYVFTILMTAEDLLGTLSFEFSLNVHQANRIPPNDSVPVAERGVFRAVAAGYSGSVAYFQARAAGVGLSTPGDVSAPFEVPSENHNRTIRPPEGITILYAPDPAAAPAPGEIRTATLALRSEPATGSSSVAENFDVIVTVSVVAIPAQEELETDATANFNHPLVVPGFDPANGNFIVLGVRDNDNNQEVIGGADLFDVSGGNLQPNKIGDTPPRPEPGRYDVTVAMTHPEILGELTLTVPVLARGDLDPLAYRLGYPLDSVLVAPGYAGDLHIVNIVLTPGAVVGTRIELPAAFPAGISLTVSPNGRTVLPHLTDPLAAEAELEAAITVTLTRGALYNKLERTVVITVSALARPAPALAQAVAAPAPQNVFAAGGDILDLSSADYENGFYANSAFEEGADASSDLNVDNGGNVSAEADLAVGAYEFTVLAKGRPDASLGKFAGEVTINVSVTVARDVETITPDDVVPAAARDVTIDAAVGYSGAGYAPPVQNDYELVRESWDDAVFNYDAANEVIEITTAVGTDALSYAVTAEAQCASASGRLCKAIKITIAANFNPVFAPPQLDAAAAYLDAFAGDLRFPSRYEDGGANFAGRTLAITAVEGWPGDIADLPLAFNGDILEYIPNGAADALPAGEHTIAFEMTHPDLLGTVAFEIAANISPRALVAADYGVSGSPAAVIVPGPNGVGLSVAAATLTGGAADAVLSIPDPANFPAKLSLALSADERGFTVFVTAAFASEEATEIVIPLTVSRPGGNYAPLQISAPVTVSALRQPALIEESAVGIPHNESNLAELKTGDFANATFARVDAESDAELLVDSNTGIISTNGELGEGTYNIAVDATSPDFLGTVRFFLRLIVSERRILTPSQTVPSDQRSREIAAAAGYSGSVAFFAADAAGVTLQTPAAAPSGFNFGADGLNAAFASPDGFTLFLEAGQIPNGGDAAAADFEVAATLGGFEGENITLGVTVMAVAAPAQDAVTAAFLDGFSHALNLPSGYESGAVGRSLAVSGVGGRADGAANLSLLISGDSLEYAPGGEEDNALAAGQYTITAAMTQRDLLGTMYLEVPAEITPRAPDAEYALADLTPNRITVAAGYDGALYEVSLSAVSAVIELPSDYPEGFTMALSPDSRRATLLLDSAVSGGLERVETISLAVVRLLNGAADANYAPLAQPLRFTVLSLPALATVSLAGMATEFVPYANPLIYDFRAELGGVYAEADFGKESGAAELTISREGIVSSFSDIASPGIYTLVATAAAAAYLGRARAALELSLFNEVVSVSYSSIPADGSRGTLSASGLESGGAAALFGATVTFTAAPAEFNYVAGWSSPRCASGNRFVSENAECAFVATTAISLSAEFRPLARRIELSLVVALGELSASSGGSVLVSGAEVPHGAKVTFTATPEQADKGLYYVTSWTREPFGGGSAEAVCETEIGGPFDTTIKRCALTADRDMRIAAEFDLAREQLDSQLSIAVLHRDPFDAEFVGLLLTLGADANQTSADGEALLLRAAQSGKHLAVSILITAGADPAARTPETNRQVPHLAARRANIQLEVLRHYIAAIGQVGHSYDWNARSGQGQLTPLGIIQNWHGDNQSGEVREVAALIYERGGRCVSASGHYCSAVPLEERNPVIADDARGDVFTIVARDLGAAQFNLFLPEAAALTMLANIGWTLRVEAERPRRMILARNETTWKIAAVFTITARRGGADVRRYMVSARLAGAAADPDATLALEIARNRPNIPLITDLATNQGANVDQVNNAGDSLLIQMARTGRHLGVSILITLGADPGARSPSSNRQVPHWAARKIQFEVLQYYIAAIGLVGYSYDWNDLSGNGSPLNIVQNSHGSDRSAAARETAALIYERGGRCSGSSGGFYCDNVPAEDLNPIIADDAQGDVFTLAARDLGAAEFDLSLPDAGALTVLASIGWTLRLEAERPQRIVLTRSDPTNRRAAVFTVTAQHGGTDVRRHMISARFASAADDPNAALAAEVTTLAPDALRAADLVRQGADTEQVNGNGETLLIQAARAGHHLLVSVLITAGAEPGARSPGNNRQVPHWAARVIRAEVLRHYIAAIGLVGYDYDWNSGSDGGAPLDVLQSRHGDNRIKRARNVAALIYERGGRCGTRTGFYCDNVPAEDVNPVIADDAQGDVFILATRDLGAAEFDLSLPNAGAVTVLASIGWTLRLETERPQRIVLTRSDPTNRRAAVFTVTARYGGTDVRRHMISARFASAADNPEAALAAEAAKFSPSAPLVADLIRQGANVDQTNDAGHSLLLQAGLGERHPAVSVLIVAGADPEAQLPSGRHIPHLAMRGLRVEMLRHYIAAIGEVGHSYDWNNRALLNAPLLEHHQSSYNDNRSEAALEIAALFYERGSRCSGAGANGTGFYCDNVPLEDRYPVVADDALGDVFTVVARDLGSAEFDLSLPDADALTVLASVGWTLRLEAERPHRVVLARNSTIHMEAAVFTVTARNGGTDVRHYRILARSEGTREDVNAALSAELEKRAPQLSRVTLLLGQGATLRANLADAAGTLALQAAINNMPRAMSILITAGANPEVKRLGGTRGQIPHVAAINLLTEVLRHYVAAIESIGHPYNWNTNSTNGTPWEALHFRNTEDSGSKREIAALLYERGSRCGNIFSSLLSAGDCDIPTEAPNPVIADAARGDVFTLVARDFGTVRFDLTLPEAEALTVLASIGWSLRRDEAERPHRIVLTRNETTWKTAAVFTITARNGGEDVRHYMVSARLASAVDDPDAALAAEVTMLSPDISLAADLVRQGADTEQADNAGDSLLLQAARNGRHLAVSVLVVVGADPAARSSTNNRQVPHWAARTLQPEVLRHYIAAIGLVGHSYDWNDIADRSPLGIVQSFHGNDRGEAAREVAALIYERDGRCPGSSGFYCDNVPAETRNTVIADNARGDILTIVARDLGAKVFDLPLPTADELAALADNGWNLRLETDRPHRIVLTRSETTRKAAAVFTITARSGNADVRHYMVSARLASAEEDPDAELAAELATRPDHFISQARRVKALFNQGATLRMEHAAAAGTVMIVAAKINDPALVSILITAGAPPGTRDSLDLRQVPHIAAHNKWPPLLQHYIAAIGQVGYSYNWNSVATRSPLALVQNSHGSDRDAETREIAALIYERGGRCPALTGFYCDNVPTETRNTVIADDARGDVLTIVARDFGTVQFDLTLPEAEALTVLASIGWTLRLETERPRRVVLTRGGTARKVAAVFTITARSGNTDVRHYMVSARLASAVDNPDAALAAEVTMLSPNLSLVVDLINQGADTEQVNDGGETPLLQAARNDQHLLVSVLITAGADPGAQSPSTNRRVPHWATRDLRFEVLRHYIAAIGLVGYQYDWNNAADAGTPLDILQNWHGNNRSDNSDEAAALIYERGGRCATWTGFYCDNVPSEARSMVIADDARGDVFTIVARDFGAAEFDLSLPDANALTVLASVGWTLRLDAAERPHRVVLERGATTRKVAAVFTVTARNGSEDVRHYMVSARLASAVDNPDAALAAEITMLSPDLSLAADLVNNQGANVDQVNDGGDTLLLQMALDDQHLAVSILIVLGADPGAQSPSTNRRVPHWAARDLRLEVLRHYIAAIGLVGYQYDWNNAADAGTPLGIVQSFHGNDQGEAAREVAALIYERGGRCPGRSGFYCDNVPSEARSTVIADDARGDVFTLVARDFGAAEFDLSLPDANALTVLASVGWTLRLDAAERPHRVVLERGATTRKVAAVFTVTARNGSEDVRHYMVSARLASAEDDPSAALAMEVTMSTPDISRIFDLLNQGADTETPLLQAAQHDQYLLVSILITAGANPGARSSLGSSQIPHEAAYNRRIPVLRHYIAAIGQVGYSYDWNDVSSFGTPLDIIQRFHGNSRNVETTRAVADLIYERGGRCATRTGFYCDNVPSETLGTVVADDAQVDVLTIVARDFGAAEFDLSLPATDELTVLASIGLSLRFEAERPQRVVVARNDMTMTMAAVFTITARNGGDDVRRYIVSASPASAARDAALAAAVTTVAPDLSQVADLLNQGADTEQVNRNGETLLLQAARNGQHLLVSILITAGADPGARSPSNSHQVPHWAAQDLGLEVLRHYIAAIGQAGYSYDWNVVSDIGAPLEIIQASHGSDRREETREIAALIYERGGRCSGSSGFYCDNVPLEERSTVIADDAQGDVLTIIARDFGAAEFDLSLPATDELTVLADIGWTLRLETERPQRIVLTRNETTHLAAAVFTITARNGGADARHYMISARLASAVDDPDAALAAELMKAANVIQRVENVIILLNQGATLRIEHADTAGTIMLAAAQVNLPLAVSILITAGANPGARNLTTNRQVPHSAAHTRRLPLLRHYIAAIGQVGYSYDWNVVSDIGAPLEIIQASHGSDRREETREIAALIYERGGRCSGSSGFYCDNVPLEERSTVIADDAQGDVLTIIARDFGAAEFDLSLPATDELTVLADIGWTLRLEAERPHRVVLTRGETTRKVAAVFTITAQYGGTVVRHYRVSARLASAVDDPDAALAAEVTMMSAPNISLVREFLNQGADVEQTDNEGDTLLLQAAEYGRHQGVSVLIIVGANPDAQNTNEFRVPHAAAHYRKLEVLRYYIAAIGQIGYSYAWNRVESDTPLDWVQYAQGTDAEHIAALIYERGGRCARRSGFYCDTVPSERRNTVIADDARGDVLTIVARDFGAAEFDLSLPAADELTVLASIGLSLRLETERPQRVVVARNDMTMTMAAVFTITARNDGADVRHYIISAGVEGASGFAPPTTTPGRSAPDGLRTANLSRNPVLSRSLSRSGVEPPTGTIHPRESSGTTDRKQELMSWRVSGFGIAWEYLAEVDRSGLVPVLVPVGG